METVHFVSHVSHEVAKLLRKAGFDWSSIGYYNKLGFFHNAIPQHDELKAPSLDVAQRWLREKWDLIITIEYNYHKNTFICKVYSKAECLSILFDFSVYEEAQEAGIKKALEIILEKGE